jgi:hypothetical protein
MSRASLRETKLYDILQTKSAALDVEYNTPIKDVLAEMKQYDIISVPVYGPPGRFTAAGLVEARTKTKQYIGIVSVSNNLNSFGNDRYFFRLLGP